MGDEPLSETSPNALPDALSLSRQRVRAFPPRVLRKMISVGKSRAVVIPPAFYTAMGEPEYVLVELVKDPDGYKDMDGYLVIVRPIFDAGEEEKTR